MAVAFHASAGILVPRNSDSLRKSRGAAPGWQGATTENSEHVRWWSNAARQGALPEGYVTIHCSGTLGISVQTAAGSPRLHTTARAGVVGTLRCRGPHRASRLAVTGAPPARDGPPDGDTLMSKHPTILRDPLLSVVMPVFNEAGTVEDIVSRVLAVPLRIELIVVDDCSTDGTREALEEAAGCTRVHAAPAAPQPGQGCRVAARVRGGQWRSRRCSGCGSGVLAGRVSDAHRADLPRTGRTSCTGHGFSAGIECSCSHTIWGTGC